ncbi:hypothetical protein IC006_0639 [Sulfuracidifex tepidarius]|uniref:Uncharacterized protein n=1 Tax=Sulfuracidifex tepidarius TaxID=1294262 RepID=A0A510DT82_9CREN|nr:hypothetical protein IC006_0637 [Sulfuracidifex tepidarius]BBG23355.1 hypothetical protein IC006_0639 [Sulfuracidifex tepidarius]BBG26108.1 hypothetical protein IC007_0613 [Sulfuracidifex tepidarius]BBG26110.1 hypothetical protein IC007_0615 [Sulfuracidifex tepidarius]
MTMLRRRVKLWASVSNECEMAVSAMDPVNFNSTDGEFLA